MVAMHSFPLSQSFLGAFKSRTGLMGEQEAIAGFPEAGDQAKCRTVHIPPKEVRLAGKQTFRLEGLQILQKALKAMQ